MISPPYTMAAGTDRTRSINGHTGENYGKDGPQELSV